MLGRPVRSAVPQLIQWAEAAQKWANESASITCSKASSSTTTTARRRPLLDGGRRCLGSGNRHWISSRCVTPNSNVEDRFVTLGYLAQAFGEEGDSETMLRYSLQQLELANARDDAFMKCEALLNLAKTYEHLSDFSKAISYARASLQHPSLDPKTPGHAHLVVAMAQLGFGHFQPSLQAFEQAMTIATSTGDKLLELQVCIGLGALFTLLRDLSKSLVFLRNALAILQVVSGDEMHAKHRSLILYHLSIVLRIRGQLVDAKEACDEALRLALDTASRTLQARCLCSLADIYRELGESEAKETLTKSWARYEDAFRLMRGSNDRLGEVVVLGSMAKSASESRTHYTGQCECQVVLHFVRFIYKWQAIQLNKKCLEIAKSIGCKHAMLKCHMRLAELYSQLRDEESEEVARRCVTALTQQMQLFCNFCGQRFGLHDESLQAMTCSHIYHESCLQTFLTERSSHNCPKCQCRATLVDYSDQPTTSAAALDLSIEQNHVSVKLLAPEPPPRKPVCGDFPVFLPPPRIETILASAALDDNQMLVCSRSPTVTDV